MRRHGPGPRALPHSQPCMLASCGGIHTRSSCFSTQAVRSLLSPTPSTYTPSAPWPIPLLPHRPPTACLPSLGAAACAPHSYPAGLRVRPALALPRPELRLVCYRYRYTTRCERGRVMTEASHLLGLVCHPAAPHACIESPAEHCNCVRAGLDVERPAQRRHMHGMPVLHHRRTTPTACLRHHLDMHTRACRRRPGRHRSMRALAGRLRPAASPTYAPRSTTGGDGTSLRQHACCTCVGQHRCL